MSERRGFVRRKRVVSIGITVGVLLTTGSEEPLAAQDGFLLRSPTVQLTARAGANQQLAGGDMFGELRSMLDLDRGDFRSFAAAAEVAWLATRRVDVALGIGRAEMEALSEYRRWEGSDGLPIEQNNWMRVVPVTLTARYNLVPRGRKIGSHAWIPEPFVPYVGAGAGRVWYKFEQAGEFVDVEDLSIFRARMETDGVATTGHVVVGLERWLMPQVGLNMELRYLRGTARAGGNFAADGWSVDLSGIQGGVGLSLRF